MRKLGVVLVSILVGLPAFAQSSVTSTKSAVSVPKFLQDISASVSTSTESVWSDKNGISAIQSGSATLSKDIGAIASSLTVGYDRIDKGDEATTQAQQTVVEFGYGVTRGNYSISTGLVHASGALTEAYNTNNTELAVTNALRDETSTAAGKVGLSAKIITALNFSTATPGVWDNSFSNELELTAALSVKQVKGLTLALTNEITRTVAAVSRSLSTSSASKFGIGYQINKKLSIGNTFVYAYNPSNITEKIALANATGLSYKF